MKLLADDLRQQPAGFALQTLGADDDIGLAADQRQQRARHIALRLGGHGQKHGAGLLDGVGLGGDDKTFGQGNAGQGLLIAATGLEILHQAFAPAEQDHPARAEGARADDGHAIGIQGALAQLLHAHLQFRRETQFRQGTRGAGSWPAAHQAFAPRLP